MSFKTIRSSIASIGRSSLTSTSVFALIGVVLLALISCAPVPRDPVVIARDSEVVREGRALVRGLAACGFCHGQNRHPNAVLQGGLPWYDKYGEVKAPNLTPDQNAGIGALSASDVIRVLRGGWAKDDRVISLDVHRGYEWMSDKDLTAIVSYLRSLPPVPIPVERRSLGFFARNVKGFFDSAHEVRGYIPETARRFGTQYGRYLVDHVARCGFCHNGAGGIFSGEPYLVGGKTIKTEGGEKIAPRLVGKGDVGVGDWSDEQFMNFFRRGVTPEGEPVDPRFCPLGFYREAPDADLLAISAYLRGLSNP